MQQSDKTFPRHLQLYRALLLAIPMLIIALYATSVIAGPLDNISGVAFGGNANIGWISLNCTNDSSCGVSDFGVHMTETTPDVEGVFSGYMWNDTTGWITWDINEATASGSDLCPPPLDGSSSLASCTPRINLGNGNVDGWIRATSAIPGHPSYAGPDKLGGWDGWIHLRCYDFAAVGASECSVSPYGLRFNMTDGTVAPSGQWIWGGREFVGWISMRDVVLDLTLAPAELTLVAVPAIVSPTTPVTTLIWTSPLETVFTSCVASSLPSTPTWGSATSPTPPAGPTWSVSLGGINVPASGTVYTLTCDGVIATATVLYDASIPDLVLTAMPSIATLAGSWRTTLTWWSPSSSEYTSCIAFNSAGAGGASAFSGPVTPPTVSTPTPDQPDVLVGNPNTTYTLSCIHDSGVTVVATAFAERAVPPASALSLTALPNPASFATLPEEQTTTLRWENASPSITYTTCRADDSVTDIDATTWLSFDTLDAPGFGGGEQKENIEVPNNPTTFGIQCLRTGSPIIYDEANVTVGKSTEPAPTVELTYNNFFPSTSSTIDLSYDSANADKCYADWKEGSIGAFPNPSFIVPTANDDTVLDSDVPFVTLPRTFKIICTNSAGNDSDELTVGINSPPSSGGIAPIYIEI